MIQKEYKRIDQTDCTDFLLSTNQCFCALNINNRSIIDSALSSTPTNPLPFCSQCLPISKQQFTSLHFPPSLTATKAPPPKPTRSTTYAATTTQRCQTTYTLILFKSHSLHPPTPKTPASSTEPTDYPTKEPICHPNKQQKGKKKKESQASEKVS